ncbi:MAG: biotin/lipoyl-binding protein [Clostridiaceae bacterium]|nr:biotin/lipoyl-binding protein [Clostridiaceae bacterium]
MKKYLITVNGNKYEVEVEEIASGETVRYTAQEREKPAQDTVPAQASTATSTTKATTAAAADAATNTAPAAQAKEETVSAGVPSGAHTVTAPMPGVILSVNVNTGDTVKRGDVLLVLEAMKMENEIVAPVDGKIASVNVGKGASVNVGDVLVSIS